MTKEMWLIGAGPMAVEYARVLISMKINFITIGRGKKSAQDFEEKTGVKVITGGLKQYLESGRSIPYKVIVATGVEMLKDTVVTLLDCGVKSILCEKPGGINNEQVKELSKSTEKAGANVLLAYNRRFYSSVMKAKELIALDGPVRSFHFEFTEWSHVIAPLPKPREVKENWFLANSSHVVDLAFYLGGVPKEICCYTSGSLDWHSAASAFSGAGISETGALFSYMANWDAPGRWAVEILTNKNRYYFKPMEKLQVQKLGSVAVDPVEIDDEIDKQYKPGLWRQTEAFLSEENEDFISIHDQLKLASIYKKMAGY